VTPKTYVADINNDWTVTIGNQSQENTDDQFLQDGQLLKENEVVSYIHERSQYWDVLRQLSQNELVRCIRDSYKQIEDFCLQTNSKDKLRQFLKETAEGSQPLQNLFIIDVLALKIVAEDCLARLEGRTYFPSNDWVEQLVWIQSTKLFEKIRARDGFRQVNASRSREDARARKLELAKKMQFEEDLAILKSKLEQARIDLALAPTRFKANKSLAVAELEERIKQLEQSKEPFSNSMRGLE
jgi:hypothetical protein